MQRRWGQAARLLPYVGRFAKLRWDVPCRYAGSDPVDKLILQSCVYWHL